MTAQELPARLLRMPGTKPELVAPTDPLTDLQGDMRAVISLAFELAATKLHDTVDPRELLAALIGTPCAGRDALCLALMRPQERSPKRALQLLQTKCGMMRTVVKPRPPADPPIKLCLSARHVLREAAQEAREMGSPVAGTEHVALALFRVRRRWYMASAIKLGLTYFDMRLKLTELRRVQNALRPAKPRRGTTQPRVCDRPAQPRPRKTSEN